MITEPPVLSMPAPPGPPLTLRVAPSATVIAPDVDSSLVAILGIERAVRRACRPQRDGARPSAPASTCALPYPGSLGSR